jgi:hypothetical protein
MSAAFVIGDRKKQVPRCARDDNGFLFVNSGGGDKETGRGEGKGDAAKRATACRNLHKIYVGVRNEGEPARCECGLHSQMAERLGLASRSWVTLDVPGCAITIRGQGVAGDVRCVGLVGRL